MDRTYEARKSLGLIHDFRFYKKYFLDIENGIAGDFAYDSNKHINGLQQTIKEQAARIARLEQMLGVYRKNVPLGHQPHMMAHKADQLLNESPPTIVGSYSD